VRPELTAIYADIDAQKCIILHNGSAKSMKITRRSQKIGVLAVHKWEYAAGTHNYPKGGSTD
jgi:hypothetical protein